MSVITDNNIWQNAWVVPDARAAALQWIKNFGEKLAPLQSDNHIKVVELDELHTYVGQKKTIAGYGLLLIEMGKNSSIAYWVPAEPKPAHNSGI